MDTTENPDPKVFYVGLCMAGAVSAGAYTAGVMDYLLEALAEWEKRRGEPGVPAHKVQIPVMGGASAGGMTSIIGATSLNNPLPPIDKPVGPLLAEHPENKLYHSWVDLTAPDMFSKMLGTSDIKPGKILSALNSEFISPIADRVVSVDPTKWQPLPAFIKPGLKIFTTLTNLQGFAYTVDFGVDQPQTSKYHMSIHNDYACFELTEDKIEGDNNGWIPLNIKDKINTDVAANAAMATGAFPVGLQSRLLTRDSLYVSANPWLAPYIQGNPLPAGDLETLNVDGGMINNEPFDKVRDVLNGLPDQEVNNYNNFDSFTNTILMIEPFPTKKPGIISKSRAISNVVGLTLSSMLAQMRAKPVNIKDAMSKTCAGQFLITPSRLIKNANGTVTTLVGEMAIACGALQGFAGFMNKEFRVHDYFLGRYNCKIFLRDYFTIPAADLQSNPIFKDGYAGIDMEKFKSTKDNSYQIIPVFADATDYTFPDFKFSSGTNWPTVQESDIDKFNRLMRRRIQAVMLSMADLNWFTRFFTANKIVSSIKSELQVWKLLP